MEFEAIGKVAAGLMPLVEKSKQSPLQLAARLAGLGQAEMKAGIPKWAWAGVGLVTGATLVWMFGDEIKKKLGRKT